MYNGWTNWETWQVENWYGEQLDGLRQYDIVGVVCSAEQSNVTQNTLAYDIVSTFFEAVNWQELADAHAPEESETGEDCETCWGIGELGPLTICPDCNGSGYSA